MTETRVGVTESPRTRVAVTPVAQVTGTFRTRSRSSIYSNVSRSYNVRVPPGVMSGSRKCYAGFARAQSTICATCVPSSRNAPRRYRFPRRECAWNERGTANSIGKRMSHFFFLFFFSSPRRLSSPRRGSRIITSQFTQERTARDIRKRVTRPIYPRNNYRGSRFSRRECLP